MVPTQSVPWDSIRDQWHLVQFTAATPGRLLTVSVNRPHALGLLRARREWPRDARDAEHCDEFASLHSITGSGGLQLFGQA